MMSAKEKLKAKRQEILTLAQRHGARNVRIFGSVARGDDDELSDVDFLVAFEKDRTLMDHAALWVELEKLLGCKVDVAADDCLRPAVKERVLHDAVNL